MGKWRHQPIAQAGGSEALRGETVVGGTAAAPVLNALLSKSQREEPVAAPGLVQWYHLVPSPQRVQEPSCVSCLSVALWELASTLGRGSGDWSFLTPLLDGRTCETFYTVSFFQEGYYLSEP